MIELTCVTHSSSITEQVHRDVYSLQLPLDGRTEPRKHEEPHKPHKAPWWGSSYSSYITKSASKNSHNRRYAVGETTCVLQAEGIFPDTSGDYLQLLLPANIYRPRPLSREPSRHLSPSPQSSCIPHLSSHKAGFPLHEARAVSSSDGILGSDLCPCRGLPWWGERILTARCMAGLTR
jgi:hypothetical protein